MSVCTSFQIPSEMEPVMKHNVYHDIPPKQIFLKQPTAKSNITMFLNMILRQPQLKSGPKWHQDILSPWISTWAGRTVSVQLHYWSTWKPFQWHRVWCVCISTETIIIESWKRKGLLQTHLIQRRRQHSSMAFLQILQTPERGGLCPQIKRSKFPRTVVPAWTRRQ